VATQLGWDAARQPSGVAVDDAGVAGGALTAGQGDVGPGDRDPAGFVLDTQGVTAGVDGFDEGGADAGERVEHEVAGVGVVGDQCGGQVRGHPGRVGAGAGDESAASLHGEAALSDQDDRQQRRVGGVSLGRRPHLGGGCFCCGDMCLVWTRHGEPASG
jgi:hypothetical protein